MVPSFTPMTLALGLVASTSNHKVSVFTHDQQTWSLIYETRLRLHFRLYALKA